MSSAISSSLLTASVAAANSSPTSTAAQRTQPPPQTESAAGADTVKLSETQQVYQLYNQGQQVPQIAASLSISEDEVNTYLGISIIGG